MSGEACGLCRGDEYKAGHYGCAYSIGYDAGWLACEAAEEESLRRHRTEFDRVREELSQACTAWIDHASTLAGSSGDRMHDAALRLLAITASRAALPRPQDARAAPTRQGQEAAALPDPRRDHRVAHGALRPGSRQRKEGLAVSDPFPTVTGRCPMCGGSLFLASGGYVTCRGGDCPNPTAIADILCDPEREHIVVLDEVTFSIRHPLRERVMDEPFDCGLHQHIANLSGPPSVPGRYRVIECRGQTWDHAAWERL